MREDPRLVARPPLSYRAVTDLRAAIRRAATRELDRGTVRANALRFSSPRFWAQMEGIVHETARR